MEKLYISRDSNYQIGRDYNSYEMDQELDKSSAETGVDLTSDDLRYYNFKRECDELEEVTGHEQTVLLNYLTKKRVKTSETSIYSIFTEYELKGNIKYIKTNLGNLYRLTFEGGNNNVR